MLEGSDPFAPGTSMTFSSYPAVVLAGDLAEHPVPRQLLSHFHSGSTGVLRMERGKVFKELLLHNGVPVGSRSNMRSEALGSMLVARGIITESQLNFLLGEMRDKGTKMGETLIGLGWLTPEDILAFFGAQNKMRVVDALRWTDGAFEFDENPSFLSDVIEHPVEIPGVIFWGLKKTAEPARLVEQFLGQNATMRVLVSPHLMIHRGAFAQLFGSDAITALESQPRVQDLVTGPNAGTTAAALDALLLCELVALKAPSSVPVEAVTHAVPMPDPETARARDVAELRQRIELQAEISAAIATTLALDPDDSGVGNEDGAPSNEFDLASESGVISIDALSNLRLQQSESQDNKKSTRPTASTGAAEAEGILREFLRIHGKNLYDILEVDHSASANHVLTAFETKRRALQSITAPDTESANRIQEIQFTYSHAFQVLSDPKFRRAYDEDQNAEARKANLLEGEMAFNEGRRLFKEGLAEKAVTALAKAIQSAPDQAQYQAWYTWSVYSTKAISATEARRSFDHAIALDSECVDAQAFLGAMSAAEHDETTARTALERTLALDPTRLESLGLLETLLSESGEFHVTEQLYRHLIQAVDRRHVPVLASLWRGLANLYETEFEDLAAARTAYEVAARLEPRNAELQRKVVELGAQELDRWKDISRAMASEWHLKPADATLGTALFNLYRRVGKRDGAGIVASAMVIRNAATAIHREIADRHRPRKLQRLNQPLDASTWGKIRHEDENVLIEALFSTLTASGLLPSVTPQQAGLAGARPLSRSTFPEPFGSIFDYVSRSLGIVSGIQVMVGGAGRDVQLLPTQPFTLLVGPELIGTSETIEIAFRLGRALSFATPSRIAAASRTGRHLRPYLVACMAHGLKTVSSSEPEVLAILEKIAAAPEDIRNKLGEIGARIARERKALNLSAWTRAVRRTAARLGMVISRDVQTSARIIGEVEDIEAREALLDFAVSPEHLELRSILGAIVAEPPPVSGDIGNRRQSERVDLEIEIGMESDTNFYTGIMQDISAGGVFVATHNLHKIGEKMRIELRLPGTPHPLVVHTVVSWIRQESNGSADEPAAGMGLRFIAPDPALVAACNRFMEQRESLFYDTE